MGSPISAEAALARIVAGLSGSEGPDPYTSCARHLARALGVRMAVVAEFVDARAARQLGAWSEDGRPLPAVSPRPGTAWALLVERGAMLHAAGLRASYPEDEDLARSGLESLAGRVLRDSDGLPAGLVAVLDTRPLAWTPEADAVLTIFAFHAESELRRSRAERRLSRIASQWMATMDTMPEFVAVIDPGYSLLRVNRTLARWASSHPRELVGRKCHDVLHGLDHPWPGCPHEQALRGERSVSREVCDPHLGLTLQVTCTPLLDAGGTALGTVHVARDISEQKQAALLRDGQIEELKGALARARNLSGVLPICSFCKRIRNDRGLWEQVEVYVRGRSEACFTHTLCPECARTHYPGMAR